MKQCIGVRVDANEKIGMGHLMRCRTIALELAKAGCRVVFFTSHKKCTELLKQWGFEACLLETDPYSADLEVPFLTGLLKEKKVSLLLVDSYQVTPEYLLGLQEQLPVYLMDDLGDQAFPVQGIINYNLYAKDLPYGQLYEGEVCGGELCGGVKEPPKFLLGSEYAPVRKEFSQVQSRVARAQGEISQAQSDGSQMPQEEESHILITMGGSDPLEITGTLAERIVQEWNEENDYVLDLVCGAMCAGRERLVQLSEQYKGKICLHTNVQDMWNLMAKARIAVCAAGSTMYELCTVGVPTITCYYVENQKKAAMAFGRDTLVLNAGDYRKDPKGVLDRILEQIESLWKDSEKRLATVRSMQKLVDGKGAERIAEALMEACR